MVEDVVKRVIDLETEATEALAEAERQAAAIVEQARAEAQSLHDQMLNEARRQAQEILQSGEDAAAAERKRIIAEAEAEAERVTQQAADHVAAAVDFVVDQVIGRM